MGVTTMRLKFSFLALVAVAALALLACGGGGDGNGTDANGSSEGDTAVAEESNVADLIEELTATLQDGGGPRFGELNLEQVRRMLTIEDDGPFYMVNLIKFRERADYRDGRETNLTGREADALYQPLPFLLEIGAEPVFVADVEIQLIGDETVWERVAVVRYPSRAAFLKLIQRPDFRAATVHKDAGVEKSLVLVAEPIEFPVEIPSVDYAEVPNGPTEDDPSIAIVHLMAFNAQAQYEDGRETDLTGREALALYEQSATIKALPLGVRPAIWLRVEGEFLGDGRQWDEFRINRFPSHAAFAALTSDPIWAGD